MKARTRLVVLAAALLGSSLFVSPVHADPESMATYPTGGIDRPGAPPPLGAVKRVAKLAAALKQLGSTQAPPQTLEMRLTPLTPRLPNGARIVRAGVGTFNGADTKEPDGSFTLMRGVGAIAISTVEMRVPTEPGKFYLVDCRVRAQPGMGTSFALTRGATSSVLPVEDGHIITAFAATAAETTVAVAAMPNAKEQGVVLGYFYGCDVGKAS